MKKTEINEACEILGERLKRERLKKNLTQRDLAELAQISRGKVMETEWTSQALADTPKLFTIFSTSN